MERTLMAELRILTDAERTTAWSDADTPGEDTNGA